MGYKHSHKQNNTNVTVCKTRAGRERARENRELEEWRPIKEGARERKEDRKVR